MKPAVLTFLAAAALAACHTCPRPSVAAAEPACTRWVCGAFGFCELRGNTRGCEALPGVVSEQMWAAATEGR